MLGKVYFNLTKNQLTENEIKKDFKPVDGKVSFENFIARFKRKCDEQLPTILIKEVTYKTNLFYTKMSKAEERTKLI